MNQQRTFSILRQGAAFAGIVMAALTQALGPIKLPPVASGIIGGFGIIILGIEHFVADPSTGSSSSMPTEPPVTIAPTPATIPPAPPSDPARIVAGPPQTQTASIGTITDPSTGKPLPSPLMIPPTQRR